MDWLKSIILHHLGKVPKTCLTLTWPDHRPLLQNIHFSLCSCWNILKLKSNGCLSSVPINVCTYIQKVSEKLICTKSGFYEVCTYITYRCWILFKMLYVISRVAWQWSEIQTKASGCRTTFEKQTVCVCLNNKVFSLDFRHLP